MKRLRIRYFALTVLGLYGVNYVVTPQLVGPARLEAHARPRGAERFDAKTWEKSGWLADKVGARTPGSLYGKRYEMVDDLLAVHLFVGMEAAQVRAMLGEPDAGIVDKKYLLATPDPYGGHQLNPVKEILESTDSIAIWAYHLAHQRQYPARSLWFPGFFANGDHWKLLVGMRNGKVFRLGVGT